MRFILSYEMKWKTKKQQKKKKKKNGLGGLLVSALALQAEGRWFASRSVEKTFGY